MGSSSYGYQPFGQFLRGGDPGKVPGIQFTNTPALASRLIGDSLNEGIRGALAVDEGDTQERPSNPPGKGEAKAASRKPIHLDSNRCLSGGLDMPRLKENPGLTGEPS